ncbi:MAG: precorrin-6A reductase [Huintestinicola sp.]
MKRLLIFGGTTEGRELAEFVCEKCFSADICVTTEYGAELLPHSDCVNIKTGKLDEKEMTELIEREKYAAVIDATHPYAKEASANISESCRATGTRYIRVVRNEDEHCENALYFDSMVSLVDFLEKTQGNIFVATGSKELSSFCRTDELKNRCTARVLDSENVKKQCIDAGFPADKLIFGKGPFSVEDNISALKKCDAKWLVTKESGSNGGFFEKIMAAEKCGTRVLVLRREKENGCDIYETKKIIAEICGK